MSWYYVVIKVLRQFIWCPDTDRKMMQIFVMTPAGRTIILDVSSSDLVDVVKHKIEAKENIPEDDLFICYGGKHLENGHNLFEYNVQKESTLHMSLRMRGV